MTSANSALGYRFLVRAAVAVMALLAVQHTSVPAEEALQKPRDQAESVAKFRIAEHDLYPESIAFDPVSGDFFLGSMGRPRILRIRPDGSYEDFLSADVPGLASSIGMKVDSKRRTLWVCTGRFGLLADYAAAPP